VEGADGAATRLEDEVARRLADLAGTRLSDLAARRLEEGTPPRSWRYAVPEMSTGAATDPRSWLPQDFGKRRAQEIRDPIVEPLWDGDRVIVHVEPTGVTIIDSIGEPIVVVPEIEAAVAEAAQAERLVIDGYLTPQAARSSEGAMLADVDVPTAKDMTTQMLLGRGGEKRRGLADQPPPPVRPGDPIVLVCIDLLAIDDESLLDIPLLERKRILDSSIDESQLVRIGAYVRLPVHPWIGSWRSQGFRALAYKDPNGRYTPGVVADSWAIAQIPKR
jgi:ATP-dependent DNA ligase